MFFGLVLYQFYNLKLCCLADKDSITSKVLELKFVFIQFQYKTLKEALAMSYIMLFVEFEKDRVQFKNL